MLAEAMAIHGVGSIAAVKTRIVQTIFRKASFRSHAPMPRNISCLLVKLILRTHGTKTRWISPIQNSLEP